LTDTVKSATFFWVIIPIEIDRKIATKFMFRGDSYVKLKRYEDALADYDEAIDLDDYYVAYCRKGEILYFSDEIHDAIDGLNNAIERKPDYAHAYYLRGLCYLEIDNEDDAEYDLEKACDLGHEEACEALEEFFG